MFWSCSRKGWDALGDKSAKRPSSAQLSEVAVFAGYKVTFRIDNRPFYRYGGHSELIRFKEYYGMPRGGGADMSRIRYARSVFTRAFRANFSSSFPRKRL